MDTKPENRCTVEQAIDHPAFKKLDLMMMRTALRCPIVEMESNPHIQAKVRPGKSKFGPKKRLSGLEAGIEESQKVNWQAQQRASPQKFLLHAASKVEETQDLLETQSVKSVRCSSGTTEDTCKSTLHKRSSKELQISLGPREYDSEDPVPSLAMTARSERLTEPFLSREECDASSPEESERPENQE